MLGRIFLPGRAPAALAPPRRFGRVVANELVKGALVAGSAVPGQRPERVLRVIELQHVKPGKGVAYVQAKMRCVQEMTVVPHKFRSSEPVETVELDSPQGYTVLYFEGATAHLMHEETFEQIEVPLAAFGDRAPWLQEGMAVRVRNHNGVPLELVLPPRAAYEVIETRAGGREGKSDNSKPATLVNGVKVRVPHFVATGDVILINTEDGSYVGKHTSEGGEA